MPRLTVRVNGCKLCFMDIPKDIAKRSLAEKIRTRRETMGREWTQEKVCSEVVKAMAKLHAELGLSEEKPREITRASIAQWESANPRVQTVPTPLCLLALADVLKVSPKWLLDPTIPAKTPIDGTDGKLSATNVQNLGIGALPRVGLFSDPAIANSKRGIGGLWQVFGMENAFEASRVGLLGDTGLLGAPAISSTGLLPPRNFVVPPLSLLGVPPPSKGVKERMAVALTQTNSPLTQIRNNTLGKDVDEGQAQWDAARVMLCGKYKNYTRYFDTSIRRNSLHFKADFFDDMNIVEFGVLRGAGSVSTIYQKIANLLLAESLYKNRNKLIKTLIMFAPDEKLLKTENYRLPDELKETLKEMGIDFEIVTNGAQIYEILDNLLPF